MSAEAPTSQVEVEPGLAAPESGPRQVAPPTRRLCDVVAGDAVGSYRMIGVEDRDGPQPLPGQFYMLAAETGWGSDAAGERPYLARAFSVCRVRGPRLDFLLEAIGPGTDRLAELTAGEKLWLVGPLGLGFSSPAELTGDPAARALLVAGGVGVAPLVIWSEELTAQGCRSLTLLGFRNQGYVAAAGLFGGDHELASDDGSTGHHGLVTELLDRQLDDRQPQAVYACGPPPMLEAVRASCVERGVAAQLALESPMACGFGACFGCVVRTRDGYRRLCVDGPVVRADDLHEDWH